MTLDDMKALLAGRLGQRSDIDNMIYSEIRQAQRVLEKTPPYPWFLMSQQNTEALAGEQWLQTPADFIEMADYIVFICKATADTKYYAQPFKVYGGYQEHIQTMGRDARGRPRNFNLQSTNQAMIQFYPTPDISYTVQFFYYRRDTELSGPASTNIWSVKGEDILIAEAGWHVARNIRDTQRASEFGQDRAEARRRIAQETTSRLESMRRAIIGSGEDALLGQAAREDVFS